MLAFSLDAYLHFFEAEDGLPCPSAAQAEVRAIVSGWVLRGGQGDGNWGFGLNGMKMINEAQSPRRTHSGVKRPQMSKMDADG